MLFNSEEHITVFEHQSLFLNKGEQRLTLSQLNAFQQFYGAGGVPYFTLIHQGVRFCEYVGVIKIGNTIINVLPKAERFPEKKKWNEVLIGMLKTTGLDEVNAPSMAALKLKNNSILDLYFEWFLNEVSYLVRRGLIKRYRKTEDNVRVLKGNLLFGKHITKNIVHKEKFYVRHTTYDNVHRLNCILYKTLRLLFRLNTGSNFRSAVGSLLLNFPELPDIKVNETMFKSIAYSRKNLSYKTSIVIARLILLNYHPDVNKGNNEVLALMFDMNKLWERFIYSALRKHRIRGIDIIPQKPRNFWKPDSGRKQVMKPDIVIKKNEEYFILDTKWKNLGSFNSSPDDLRQLYVYSKFHNNAKAALVYPGEIDRFSKGYFYDEKLTNSCAMECGLFTTTALTDVRKWQLKISNMIFNQFNLKE